MLNPVRKEFKDKSEPKHRYIAKFDLKQCFPKHILYQDVLEKEKFITALEIAGKLTPSFNLVTHYYCFDEFYECSYDVYCNIAEMCKKYGIAHVYDIGCCFPFQARIFNEFGIKYTGIEVIRDFRPDIAKVDVIFGKYPFDIRVTDKKHTAAISNLCVGYQANGQEVANQIAKDFNYFCGYVPGDFRNLLLKKFSVLEKKQGNFGISFYDKLPF